MTSSHFLIQLNFFKKIAAIETLKKAVDIFSDLGRFNIAAKHQKEIAEIYERLFIVRLWNICDKNSSKNSELVDLPKAIEAYELAAEWYQGEESKSLIFIYLFYFFTFVFGLYIFYYFEIKKIDNLFKSNFSAANNCLLKVALFSAQIEKYEKAIKIYEQVQSFYFWFFFFWKKNSDILLYQIATSAIDTPVLRFSVKDYFLRAGLCHLCTGVLFLFLSFIFFFFPSFSKIEHLKDTVTTQRALERYLSMDSSLNTTREYTFLKVCFFFFLQKNDVV